MKKTGLPGDLNLLGIANHLSALAKKAEDPDLWADECLRQARVLISEEQAFLKRGLPVGGLNFKITQLLREAGLLDDDVALAYFHMSFTLMEDHGSLPVYSDIEKKRDELQKGIDPKNKKEMLTLGKGMIRCYFASFLRYHGEYQAAALVLDDPETFNRRFKEGMLRSWKNSPDVHLDDDFFENVSF